MTSKQHIDQELWLQTLPHRMSWPGWTVDRILILLSSRPYSSTAAYEVFGKRTIFKLHVHVHH